MDPHRLTLHWAGGVLAVVVLAAGLGTLAWALTRAAASPGATFADLGALIAGMAVAALAASVGWLVLVALLAARHAASGRRLLLVAQCLGALAAAAVVGFGSLAVAGGLDEHSDLAVGFVLLVAVLAPPLLARRGTAR